MRKTRNLCFVFFPQMLPHCESQTLLNISVPTKLIPTPAPVDPIHLLNVRVVLYQQQNSSDAKVYSNLHKINFSLSHEFFIQVCNNFPFSWKPIYRFFNFSLTQPDFCHSSVTYNKMLDVYGRSKNITILWEFVNKVAEKNLATDATFRIVVKHLAAAKELKKCVEFFHLMNESGFCYRVEILNKVVETLCGQNMVDEAKHVIIKMKPWIKPSEITYGILVSCFCDRGDLVEACKIWNLIVEEGLQPEVSSSEKIMERFFKCNRLEDGMIFFKTIRLHRFHDVGPSTYGLVIVWMCKKHKLHHAFALFCEMLKRGVGVDDDRVISALVYGLLSKRKVREAFRVFHGLREPDLIVYNELIKGLLRIRKTSEATEVFRQMCHRGCEPNMHTYIMLLQGHLGKRGRKGPHPEVNFESIFVGGLVKVGKTLEATKYVERMIKGCSEVPRFDYNKFLYEFSNEEGTVMFREVGAKLREVGLVDLGDIFTAYGARMTTRDRRRRKIEV
ncbi:putative pentatricopeptide repeat-containing protein At1g26500 [Aristolochia californica]|uniref:putative pentatricopeptide repeat-containing protein At1g26500 n=1 Tax=Aristolochia californica TaxID=171875 RepID=UPI0035DA57C6